MASEDTESSKCIEPEDKEEIPENQEIVIQFYLEAFHHYIQQHIDWKDLLHYKYFTPGMFENTNETLVSTELRLSSFNSIVDRAVRDNCLA